MSRDENYFPFGPILHNEEFRIGRVFHQRLDPTRTPREMAIAWAQEWRKDLENERKAAEL